MQKKGQITVFILVGIILLMVITGIFILKGQSVEKIEKKTPLTGAAIKNYVESCIQKTGEEAILENALSGGYFYLPEESTLNLTENVAFYLDGEEVSIPSSEIIAEQVGVYVDSLLTYCLDDFNFFEDKGYEIISGEPNSAVSYVGNSVNVQTTLPLEIYLGDQRKEISTFSTEFNVEQLTQNLEVATEIVETLDDGYLCTTCYVDLAEEYGLKVKSNNIFEGVDLVEIYDDDYLINKENYVLRFVVGYDDTEEE